VLNWHELANAIPPDASVPLLPQGSISEIPEVPQVLSEHSVVDNDLEASATETGSVESSTSDVKSPAEPATVQL
jgi:hypothetical protein